MFSNRRSRRKSLLLCASLAALLTVLVGYLLMHRLQTDSVQAIRQSIDAWRMTLTALRWTAITVVALGWNYLLAGLVNARALSRSEATRCTELRWRIVTWLVILELVLAQGMFLKVLGLTAEMLK